MRLPLLVILPLLVLNALIDWYICRAVWRRCTHGTRFMRTVALTSSILLPLVLTGIILYPKKSGDDAGLTCLMWVLFAYMSVYLSKIVAVAFDLISKIPQLWGGRRIKWLGYGCWLGVAVFAAIWWGALINRFNIDVKEVQIADTSLPAAFDGLRIVQISDLHTGTYGSDTTYLAKLVDRINSLEPDIIVFTGDIVNRHTAELLPFTGTLSRLHAPAGIYSILGNHDYGDYYSWPDPADKEANMTLLKDLQQSMGWHMLNNTTHMLHAGNDSIALIGVENIGDPPFPVYGNLEDAYPGDLADPVYKILLSHNPSHWDTDICGSPDKNIALTLSGHTHAMQIEICGWSPAGYRYPEWGGMYTDDEGHRLYVNIGIGTVGVPMRLGATPEVTLFTFTRSGQ